jgi:hypothetical protein
MSRAKASVLLVGLFALAAVSLVGAIDVAKSSSGDSGMMAGACEEHACAQAASSRTSGSGCATTMKSTGSCPMASASADAGKACPMSSADSKACPRTCGTKPSKTAKVESIKKREGETLVLTGRYVCGHCDLGVGEDCQPAFRTTDGKNYLLMKNNLSKQLRSDARETDVEIVSRIKKLDGVKYLEVEVVRAAS